MTVWGSIATVLYLLGALLCFILIKACDPKNEYEVHQYMAVSLIWPLFTLLLLADIRMWTDD